MSEQSPEYVVSMYTAASERLDISLSNTTKSALGMLASEQPAAPNGLANIPMIIGHDSAQACLEAIREHKPYDTVFHVQTHIGVDERFANTQIDLSAMPQADVPNILMDLNLNESDALEAFIQTRERHYAPEAIAARALRQTGTTQPTGLIGHVAFKVFSNTLANKADDLPREDLYDGIKNGEVINENWRRLLSIGGTAVNGRLVGVNLYEPVVDSTGAPIVLDDRIEVVQRRRPYMIHVSAGSLELD